MTQSRVERYRCCGRSRSAGSTFSLIETACRPDSSDRTRQGTVCKYVSITVVARTIERDSSIRRFRRSGLGPKFLLTAKDEGRATIRAISFLFLGLSFRSSAISFALFHRLPRAQRSENEKRSEIFEREPKTATVPTRTEKSLPLSRLFLLPS